VLGEAAHMQRAESTQFYLSCHVMHDFGHSLPVDDPSYIPAKHFQNNLVPRDRACYTCRTDYEMPAQMRIAASRTRRSTIAVPATLSLTIVMLVTLFPKRRTLVPYRAPRRNVTPAPIRRLFC